MSILARKRQPSSEQERARMVVGLIGLAIVIAFALTAAVVDIRRGSSPPVVRVVSVAAEHHDKSEVFTVTVENTGDITAEQVLVRGTIGDADPVDHEIDFLAPGEEDEVSFVAPAGTAKAELTPEVLAWTAAE